MTLADRLKEAMADKGLTQSALAKKAGMAQSMIWKLLSGNAVKTGRLVDLAKALDVRPEWLSDGSGHKSQSGDTDFAVRHNNRYVPVKIYEAEQETPEFFMVPAFFEQQAPVESCRAYHITQNTGCTEAPEGTVIVVDTQENIANDDLVYARIGEHYSVYRYKQGGAVSYLSVDDTRIPLIPLSSDMEIVGVIVYLFRNMKRKR
ncbi:helix-turn-helix domain-containing protein [Xenorhabdus bovienii]|uniref:helix-turn-helix domain-containing protein n=1 Tax=Xenorhabdus bovienii TaxID=40576 RepID=UPI0023B2DC9B|nr:XRE family transcriptional regulator [Xenorhabdus bovienii]MDE9435665.1 helix-turn-helix domain-containing protein [Xenorhabdus bovienii]MDE9497611.1 helix-turn-helix domain-containing protein [Xenorhabdus bovienii]